MRGCILCGVFLAFLGCAQPQTIKEVVYLDKPCDRASDHANVTWIPARWIAITIDAIGYVATPDGEALLGNLLNLRRTEQ